VEDQDPPDLKPVLNGNCRKAPLFVPAEDVKPDAGG
jgi:hypothetical protein